VNSPARCQNLVESGHVSLTARKNLTGFVFFIPALFGMSVFFLIPFGITVYYSFTSGIAGGGVFVGLENYISVLSSGTFHLAALNTMKFICVAVPLIMAFSLLIALVLNRKLKGSGFFRATIILPLVLPTVSIILFFQIIFSESGAANAVLARLGMPIKNWLQSSSAFTVLVILYIWKNCGYNIILFLAALNTIPRELYEAAELDGGRASTKLFSITLPLIMPSVFFIFIISFINSFKSFREAFLLCGAYPHRSIYMLQHFMNNNFGNLNYQRLSVGAIMVFLVIFAFVSLLVWAKNREGQV